ncbi:PAAR domain-containing protein [Labilibaculum sp. DW002]|uniref:PAAR domain-containing protein n=1 Tax=Paralabilibaculum antarcticum TaxID=2912572 RepID=A0ABT5VUU7_9BACT|nr:PAAR domain-containing protein [Labilibaculum sp. DW002]MDE5419180.1 PAAR domain-containing protein [Labilibaculum sp. DW002]
MAGKPIATMGSMHVCPMCSGTVPHVGGPISGPGAPNVLINGKPAALMGDMCVCVGPPDVVAQGNPFVLINGVPVVCQGDLTAHGGAITAGEPNVMVSVAQPNARATMPLSQIPFPEIRLFDHIGAALNSDTVDLQEAQGNIEAIQRGDAEVEPRIYNVRWVKEQNTIRESKILKEVTLRASVLNIDDGESVTFKVKKLVPNSDGTEEQEEEIVELTGIVSNKEVEVIWEIEDPEENENS